MWTCPVCDTKNNTFLCSSCGFDASQDFEQYPTLVRVAPGQDSVTRRRNRWLRYIQDLYHCPDCGGRHFILKQPDLTAVCNRCGKEIPNPEIERLRRKLETEQHAYTSLHTNYSFLEDTRDKLELQLQEQVIRNQNLQKEFAALQAQLKSLETAGKGPWIQLSPNAANVAVGAGHQNSLIVRRNGTVQVSGKFQYDISGWRHIVASTGGADHVVGLRSDGTVVAAGNNKQGQCKVSNWRDITAVAARLFHTIGLKKDGTVVAAGSNYAGQCNVSNWRDIIAISAGLNHNVGLRRNGTVVAAGSNSYKESEVYGWRDIVAVAAGGAHTVGLKKDGTVVVTGSPAQPECSKWTDIVAIAAGRNHTLGLRKDGTVVAAGLNWGNQCNTEGIRNAIAIAAGDKHSIILCADGSFTVLGTYDF